jgi:hypothetical protein
MKPIISDNWICISSDYKVRQHKEFEELSEVERRMEYIMKGKRLLPLQYVKIYKKEKNIVIALKATNYAFYTNAFVLKSKYETLATITPKRVYANDIIGAFLYTCRAMGIPIPSRNVDKTALRKLVTQGYSKALEYLEARENSYINGIHISKLKYYVDDIDALRNRHNDIPNIRDIITQAIVLDKTIKMSWSDRKFQDMHGRWTFEISKIQCYKCSEEPIWKHIPSLPKGVKLLNSEKDIAEEGINMHHCIYTNYAERLMRKKKVAFHINNNEESYTVMYDIDRNWRGTKVICEQAYGAWNSSISYESEVFNLEVVYSLVEEMIQLEYE